MSRIALGLVVGLGIGVLFGTQARAQSASPDPAACHGAKTRAEAEVLLAQPPANAILGTLRGKDAAAFLQHFGADFDPEADRLDLVIADVPESATNLLVLVFVDNCLASFGMPTIDEVNKAFRRVKV